MPHSLLVINADGPETRVALVEDGFLGELYIERKRERGIAGNIYKGRVERVLPGMQAAFVNIGLVPDGGSSLFVPSRVGFARAAELAMLGERLDARKAVDWGLINQVFPDSEFADRADALLDRLAAGATKSYAGTKRQLNHWLYERMDAQLEFEAGIQREMAASGDFAEGLAAFAAKRPPRFTGG